MLLKKMMLGILATSLITGWTGDTHLNKLKEDVTEIQTNVPKFVNTFDTFKKKFDELAQNANNKIGQANQIIEDKVQYINWLHEKLDQAAQENKQEKLRIQTLQKELEGTRKQLENTTSAQNNLQKRIQEIQDQVDTLQAEKESLENETRGLKGQVKEKEQTIQTLQNETKKLNNQVKEKEQTIQTLQNETKKLNNQVKEKQQELTTKGQQIQELEQEKQKLETQLESTEDKLKEYKKQIDTLLLEQELVNLYENGSLRESVDQDTLDRLRDKINQFGTEQKAQLLKKWEQAQVSFLKNLIQKVEYIDDILHITFKNDDYLNYGIYLYRNGKYHGSIKFDPTHGWISKDKNVQINESTRTLSSCRLTMTKCEQMISPTDDYHIEVARLYWDDTRIVYRENYIVYRKEDSLNEPENLKQQLERKEKQIQELEQEKQKLETQMESTEVEFKEYKKQIDALLEQALDNLYEENGSLRESVDQKTLDRLRDKINQFGTEQKAQLLKKLNQVLVDFYKSMIQSIEHVGTVVYVTFKNDNYLAHNWVFAKNDAYKASIEKQKPFYSYLNKQTRTWEIPDISPTDDYHIQMKFPDNSRLRIYTKGDPLNAPKNLKQQLEMKDEQIQKLEQEKQKLETQMDQLQKDLGRLKQQLESKEDEFKKYKEQLQTEKESLENKTKELKQQVKEKEQTLENKTKELENMFQKLFQNWLQKAEMTGDKLTFSFKNRDYLSFDWVLRRTNNKVSDKYTASIEREFGYYSSFAKNKHEWIIEDLSSGDDYSLLIRWGGKEYIVFRTSDLLSSPQKEAEKDQLETQMNQLQGGPESLKQQLETKDEQIQKLEQEKQKLETQMNQWQVRPENLKQQLERKDEQIQKLEQEKQKLETQMDQLQREPENLKQQLERKDKQIQELMTAKATWEKEKTELEKKLKAAEDKMERQTESDAKNTST
ncbi:hypothetical protein [Bacillus cytotoxicus]|uniref:hypothetical protein n=1 Tax=Bacillus cytotoxicus TaxID=580165 RepID=UPI003D7E5E70